MDGDKIKCPCTKCDNKAYKVVDEAKYHLYKFGFVPNYGLHIIIGGRIYVKPLLCRDHLCNFYKHIGQFCKFSKRHGPKLYCNGKRTKWIMNIFTGVVAWLILSNYKKVEQKTYMPLLSIIFCPKIHIFWPRLVSMGQN